MILASSCKPFENFLYDIYSDKKAAEAGDKKEETKTDTKEEKKEEKKEESKEEDRSIELLISFTVYIYIYSGTLKTVWPGIVFFRYALSLLHGFR